MRNFEYCQYTYRHRRAFEYVVQKLFEPGSAEYQEMMKRACAHDVDKLIMYQCGSKDEASKIHKSIASHHMSNTIPKSYYDKLEAVIDYECAGYTKPDKPLNAWDTIKRFQAMGEDETLCTELLQICEEYGLTGSYRVTETDTIGIHSLSIFSEVTEQMICDDIMSYFRHCHQNDTESVS